MASSSQHFSFFYIYLEKSVCYFAKKFKADPLMTLLLTHTCRPLGGSDGKASACNAGDLGSIPGLEDSLEKEVATHSNILAWRNPWTEERGGLQSMEFSRPEYWSGWPFPSAGDLPNPEMEPSSPALQVASLPAEPQGELLRKQGDA